MVSGQNIQTYLFLEIYAHARTPGCLSFTFPSPIIKVNLEKNGEAMPNGLENAVGPHLRLGR
jgi:hypothetical protein